MFKCKECDQKFETRKSFHSHLKAHTLCIGDYYVKHYAKKDLFSGDLLPFKNFDQYFSKDFASYENYKSWLASAPEQEVKDYILNKARKKISEKNLKLSPPNLYYQLTDMAEIQDYKNLFGSYTNFLKEVKLEPWFNKQLPKTFWDETPDDIQILVDTREQLPLNFNNTLEQKLDFGDYTANGQYYSKTFIDRKSAGDFKSTFGQGTDRFRREMDRCVQFNSYMFVVVESSVAEIEAENRTSKFKSNLSYVWHNVKAIMNEYPKNIQFVFAYSRKGSEKLIPKILAHGQDLWNVDVQYFLERRVKDVG